MIELKVVNPDILQYGIPTTETAGSAGYDLRACIEAPITVYPEQTVMIPTGVAIYIRNRALAGFVMPRSGLAAKHRLTLQNAVGLIDSDYQGELQVLLRNESEKPYIVGLGDRIAQLVFVPIVHPVMSVVTNFTPTARGTGGFGSTGVASRHLADGPKATTLPGYSYPSQSIGNDEKIEVGSVVPVVSMFEPTGSEMLEADYGD